MINVMKRLAELDSENPNIVNEVSKELASKAYNKMANGGDDSKDRTGQAGDQSDRLKAKMKKKWGEKDTDAAIDTDSKKVNESKMAELDDDLKTMSAEEFKAKYKKTKAEARAAMKPDAVNESLAECGMMPMPGMSGMSSSPANISITAGSGPELSGMLKDIMSLAGIQRSEPAAMSMTAEPEIEIEPTAPEDGMRSMIDKMNEPEGEEEFDGDEEGEEELGDEEDDEETVEGMYDNSPDIDIEGPNAFANHGNQEMGGPPGAAKGRGLTTGPRAHTSEDIESQLFAEYAKFVTEAAPSAGISKKEKSAVVKKAKAGKDIGKPGKGFEKVEKAAAKSGAKDPKAVAGAAMWKGQAKKKVKEDRIDTEAWEHGYNDAKNAKTDSSKPSHARLYMNNPALMQKYAEGSRAYDAAMKRKAYNDANPIKKVVKNAVQGVAEDAEPGYVKYEQMKDKIAGVLIKLYNQGKDPETIKQMGDRVAQHLGYDSEDSIFQDAWMTSFTDASLDGSLDQDSEDDYTDQSMRRGEMGRESMQNEAGWDKDKQDFKRREMDVELGHERNNYEVVINGRGWKVFADQRQADNIARVLRSKGKDASVQITGANPTA